MTKLDTLSCVIIFLIITMFTFAFYSQMAKEKQKILCNGELRELGSAFFIYQHKNTLQSDKEIFWREVLAPFSVTSNGFCPSANSKETFSYKLFEGSFSFNFVNKKHILFFDAIENEKSISNNPTSDIAMRHLGGANILWSDGSVQYIKEKNTLKKIVENK